MATATWEDFTGKYGFSDGAAVDARDFEARSVLVGLLNKHPAMKSARLRALEYDRPGLHNPCLVIVVTEQGEADSELLRLRLENQLVDADLPPELELVLPALIAEAYES
jgi:hypothetical protein